MRRFASENLGARALSATDWALVLVVGILVALRLACGVREARSGRFTPTILMPGEPAAFDP